MARYRRCLITSLDLFGFAALMERAGAGKVIRLLGEVRSPGGEDEPAADPFEERFFVLGGHVVRVVPLDSRGNSPYPIGLPSREMLRWIHVQAGMVPHRLFLRGALTLGDVALSKDVLFGPGIAKAQHLHATAARAPRLIVDPELLRAIGDDPLLRKDTHDIAEEQEFVRRLLRRDRDGLWFVDYLAAMGTEVDGLEEYRSFLQEHQRVLAEQLESHSALDEEMLGWGWLVGYHNTVLSRLRKEGILPSRQYKQLRVQRSGIGHYRFTLLDRSYKSPPRRR